MEIGFAMVELLRSDPCNCSVHKLAGPPQA
jgi:hypothetical protein